MADFRVDVIDQRSRHIKNSYTNHLSVLDVSTVTSLVSALIQYILIFQICQGSRPTSLLTDCKTYLLYLKFMCSRREHA